MEKQHKISELEMNKLKEKITWFSELISEAENFEEIKRLRNKFIETQVEIHPEDADYVRTELVRTANLTLSLYSGYTAEEYKKSR